MNATRKKTLTSVIHNNLGLSIIDHTSSIIISNMGTSLISHTINITNAFNSQYKSYITDLNMRRLEVENTVRNNLSIDPSYKGSRNDAISLAWDYEKADIIMGGSGSKITGWTKSEMKQIRINGKIEGVEGHHINNVANHKEMQGNPDNIRFFKTRDDHVNIGHNGDTNNESHGELIDKNRMLKQTNNKRVLRNELKGLGMAIALGVGIGFTLSFIAELAQNGTSVDNVLFSLKEASIYGLESGLISAVVYGVGRTTSLTLSTIGVDITGRIGSSINLGLIGISSIVLVGAFLYYKLRKNGFKHEKALEEVYCQSLFPIALLAGSIVVQGIYGGASGLIVSTGVGMIYFGFNIYRIIKDRLMYEKYKIITIEEYREIVF